MLNLESVYTTLHAVTLVVYLTMGLFCVAMIREVRHG